VVLVGLVGIVVAAALDRRGLGSWDLDADLDRLTAGSAVVLVAAGLLSLASSRRTRVVAVVLAAASAVVLVGVVARVFGGGADPARTSAGWRRVLPVLLATAVTALGGTAAAAAVIDAPVRATTAPEAEPAPLEYRADAAHWTWRGGGAVRDVRAAGAGVVVAGDDGVTALDGTTGAARWTFRRVGAGLTDLLVSPDRRTVVTIHAGPAARAAVLTVLDATTGERRWELVTDRKPVALLTDGVLAVDELLAVGGDDPPRSRTTARDIGSGAVLWTWEPPPGCDSTLLHPAVSATVVPVKTSCQDGLVLRGLDGRTGSVTWTLRTRPFDPYSSDPLRTTPDGTRLVAAGSGDRVVVDTATGTPVGRIPYDAGFPRPSGEGRIAVAGGDPERVVAAVDPASGALQPVQEGCPAEVTATVTDRGVLRLCRTASTFAVQTDGAAPVPVDLGRRDQFVALDLLRDAFVVPAPGAVVVGTAGPDGAVVGMG
jgi:outer membrane protein assembly factor BamB